MFFGARLKGMPPKLVTDSGEFIVIRPLAYVPEPNLVAWAEHRRFPIIPCNLCGSQLHLQRQQMGDLLRDWEKRYPGRVENMFKALTHVVPSHLMDQRLYDFKHLQASGTPDAEGDKAFDDEEMPAALPSPAGQPFPDIAVVAAP
jgi:tRNA 2-thiocytidine biosynthesis protein TtcA